WLGSWPFSSARDSSLGVSPAGGAGCAASSWAGPQAPSSRAVDRARPSRPYFRRSVFMAGLLGQNVGDAQAVADEEGAGGLLDVVGGHGFQFRQLLIDQL